MTFQQQMLALVAQAAGSNQIVEDRGPGDGLALVVPAGLIGAAATQQRIRDAAAREPHPICVVLADRDDVVIVSDRPRGTPTTDPWQWSTLSTTTGDLTLPLAPLADIVGQL